MERKIIYIIIFVLLGTSVLSFMVGMTVGAMRSEYRIIACRQSLKETKQQLSGYQSELSYLKNQSDKDFSSDFSEFSKMNWAEAVE